MDQFRRIVRALRSSHRAAAHLNLTGAQLYVINVIGEANRPLSVNEVAQRTETDQSTVSVVTNRRVELSLTASGRTLQKKAPVTVAQQRLTATLQELSSRDSDELLRVLTKIVHARPTIALGRRADCEKTLIRHCEAGTSRNTI